MIYKAGNRLVEQVQCSYIIEMFGNVYISTMDLNNFN
jgi:hypothetical protein